MLTSGGLHPDARVRDAVWKRHLPQVDHLRAALNLCVDQSQLEFARRNVHAIGARGEFVRGQHRHSTSGDHHGALRDNFSCLKFGQQQHFFIIVP